MFHTKIQMTFASEGERLLEDAHVIRMFAEAMETQRNRVERFWTVRGFCPYRFCRTTVLCGDSRNWKTFHATGLDEGSVDLVLTSPPYATALPYIDTDRLSIMLLCGVSSADRRPLERGLSGSREITTCERQHYEGLLENANSVNLPTAVMSFIKNLHSKVKTANVGFRRANMPALLLRFFLDMKCIFKNVAQAMKSGAQAMVVMGDNVTSINGKPIPVPSTEFIGQVAEQSGLRLEETIPITVTTENLVHMRNAIKRNVVLRLVRS